MAMEQIEYSDEYYALSANSAEHECDAMSRDSHDDFATAPGSATVQDLPLLNSFNAQMDEVPSQFSTEAHGFILGKSFFESGQPTRTPQYPHGSMEYQGMVSGQHKETYPCNGDSGVQYFPPATGPPIVINSLHGSESNDTTSSLPCNNGGCQLIFPPWSINEYDSMRPSLNIDSCDAIEGDNHQSDINLEDWTHLMHNTPTGHSQRTQGGTPSYHHGRLITQMSEALGYSQNNKIFSNSSPWTPLSMQDGRPTRSLQLDVDFPGTLSYEASTSMPSMSGGSSFSDWVGSGTSNTSYDLHSADMTDSMVTVRLPMSNNLTRMSQSNAGRPKNAIPSNSYTKPTRKATNPVARPQNRPQKGKGRLSPYDDSFLSPDDIRPDSRVSSPASSILSITPSYVPDVLLCLQDGCPKTFKGKYRRGTRQRHMRLKHGKLRGQEEKVYPCEAGCAKTFLRQDARLKHYRKRHAELALSAAVPRPRNRHSSQ